MKNSFLILLLAPLIVGCTDSSKNEIELSDSIKVESQGSTEIGVTQDSQSSSKPEEKLLIHYNSDDSDYGETHLKLFDNQKFLFEWRIYGEKGPSTTEEFVSKQGKWVLDKDSIATLSFEDNKHVLNLFYTDKEYEKDFTFVDSKTLKFDLKKTDIHIDGFQLTDFKRNCYCEK